MSDPTATLANPNDDRAPRVDHATTSVNGSALGAASAQGFTANGSQPNGSQNLAANDRNDRATAVAIALEIDDLTERCDRAGLTFVGYLLRVARAALGEALGERSRHGVGGKR